MRNVVSAALGALLLVITTPAVQAQAATPAPAPRAAPTAELLDKMLKLVTAKGADHEISIALANPLGLKTEAGENWLERQVAADAADKTTHGFAVSRGSDPDLVLFVKRLDGNIYMFGSSHDGKVLGALIFNRQTSTIIKRDASACQQELDDEFGYWARSVDKLLTSG